MMRPILIVLPISPSTAALSTSLLKHLGTHGPIPNHAILFVADHGLNRTIYEPLVELAKPIFPAGGNLIFNPIPVEPEYPQAHNLRFETAAKHVAVQSLGPWLFLSPRCVPVRKGWLSELENEYSAHAHQFPVMGQILTPETNGTATRLVPATAIYPQQIPKKVLQRLIAQRGVDFEKSCAEILVPITHPTQLIWNHPINGSNDLPSPPPFVSLVHTVRARDYAAALRGELAVPPSASEPKIVPTAQPLAKQQTIPGPIVTPASKAAYYHSGDLGDIIYSLAAIRLAGGGKLYLGPRSKRTPPPANPMRQPVFDLFKPLLEVQPYIEKVIFIERYPGTHTAFDLNIFRSQWGDKGLRAKTGISTLVRMHCHVLGVDEKFRPDIPWITVPLPISTGFFTCHRSPRYRSTSDDLFPWPLIVKRYKGRLLFVGLPSEHAEFERDFQCKTAFWKCHDFLEMARVIAGSLGFIGNQSFPNAIACGVGQRILQEAWPISKDCLFARSNFMAQPIAESRLDAWEKSINLITPEKPKVTIINESHRRVSTTPINGLIELGPLENAFGLGDTLTLTPLAEKLGNKAVVCLPDSMKQYQCLFDGICQTRITENYPVFQNPGNERFIESKLRMFGFECEDGKTLPIIKFSQTDTKDNPIPAETLIFHTSCSAKWTATRSRPAEFWYPFLHRLAKRVNVLTETELPSDLRLLAAAYRNAGLYFGVNTGNWHLAMAAGCRCLVVDAEKCDGYNPDLWRYNLPCVTYSGFDSGNIQAKLPWLYNPLSSV